MREIILDTETTGLDPKAGHRLVEIGAIELINHTPTGNNYQTYINPERDVDPGAFEVHGLAKEFLQKQPVFEAILENFLSFISDSILVIHNAPFDMAFINMELERLNHEPIGRERVVDTLAMARKKFPGAQASLDALCRRFSIENSHRELHGALVDADLLAGVYLELIGGKEPALALSEKMVKKPTRDETRGFYKPRSITASPEELRQHEVFLKEITNPIWKRG